MRVKDCSLYKVNAECSRIIMSDDGPVIIASGDGMPPDGRILSVLPHYTTLYCWERRPLTFLTFSSKEQAPFTSWENLQIREGQGQVGRVPYFFRL